ncbi:MAG TPA: tRNA (adenosine(37)-N6)-dimethylallyltransferase MiaA [Geopsychrobacteraceae bacterium]|nr:tRNA (adenosine(37)-N6)-dimethylallyltransferase MiaA [Geopsychrobacteraceae bacterium]
MKHVNEQIPVLVINGPTASGKSGWALELSEIYDLEIISADSRQVYRQMDIGTAKVSCEEQEKVPHHLIDLVQPDQAFSVADFVALAQPLVEKIHRRGRLPCVVGGTGLYIQALTGGLAAVPTGDDALRTELHQRETNEGEGTLHCLLKEVDPESAEKIHPRNLVRLVRALEVFYLSGRKLSELKQEHQFSDQQYNTLDLAPKIERSELYQRIDQRVVQMLEAGLLEETKRLLEQYDPQLKAMQTLGYREAILHLQGQLDYSQMVELIQTRTRQYGKRQLTWLRKNHQTIWVDSCKESDRVKKSIDNLIQR